MVPAFAGTRLYLNRVEVLGRGRGLAELDLLDRRDQLLVGRYRQADGAASLDDDAVDEVDLGAPPLLHVLAHRRALVLAALLRVAQRQHQGFDLVERGAVALRGARQFLGILAGDVLELVAERLADPDPLAAEPDDQPADPLVLADVVAREAARRRDAVMHAVDAEFRPALAPQIVGHLAGVDGADHRTQFLDARGEAAMHLADPVDLMPGRVLRAGAADLARRVELGRQDRGDRADRSAPADMRGDALLVDAVLQRDDIAGRRQILADHHRRPFGVVGFDRDEGDVDRPLLGEVLDLGQVQDLRPRQDELLGGDTVERQPVTTARLDMLGPRVAQRHVQPVMRHVPARVAGDRSGP